MSAGTPIMSLVVYSTAYVSCISKENLALVASLLSCACEAVTANPRLFLVVLLVTIARGVIDLLMLASILGASAHLQIIKNPEGRMVGSRDQVVK